MLCEKCNRAEATVHITEVVAEAPGEMKKRDLCEACFSQSELAKKVHGKTIHASKCEYCGASAATGWAADMWGADGTESEEAHFRCEQCQDDLKEFESRPENRLPELPGDFDYNDPVATKALERLMHEIREREQAFMRQKLAERKGPDHAT